jgi:hypothetical protein
MGNKLCIQNFGAAVDSWELESWFATVGDVSAVSVATVPGPDGDLRVGYVQMATAEQAADCIDRFNGQSRNGLMLKVREDKVHVPIIGFSAKKNKAQASRSAKI